MKELGIGLGVMLILAIFKLPYEYYNLLRLVVSIGGGVFSYQQFIKGRADWGISFTVIALLFNPIFPIYLSKDVWIILDLISAVVFFSISYKSNNK